MDNIWDRKSFVVGGQALKKI